MPRELPRQPWRCAVRDAVLRDRYLRCLIWISEIEAKTAIDWLDQRFPGLSDGSLPFNLPVDFLYFMHNFVYPAFIERFVPWFMPHWPMVRGGGTRITNDLEFPKTGTALITFWRASVGSVTVANVPTHTGALVLRDNTVFDPDADHLYTVPEYLQAMEKGQQLTGDAMRIVYVAEKPNIQ